MARWDQWRASLVYRARPSSVCVRARGGSTHSSRESIFCCTVTSENIQYSPVEISWARARAALP